MDFNDWSVSEVTSPIILTPRTTSEVPLTLTGLSGMTANMFEVKNSAGTVVFSVDVDGDVYYLGDETIADSLTVTGNIVGQSNLTISGTSTLGTTNITTLAVSGNSTFTGTGRFAGDLTANHNLNVNNSLNVNGYSYINAVQYFAEQASAPSAVADKGALYTKEASSVTELFYTDSAGNEVQLTSAGAVGGDDVFIPDDKYLRLGNTAAAPDVKFGWVDADQDADIVMSATGTLHLDGTTTRTGTAELFDIDATINTTTATADVVVSSITATRNSGDSGATRGLEVSVTTGDMADTVFSYGISSTVVTSACTHNTSDAAAFLAGAITPDANCREIGLLVQPGYDIGIWIMDSALQMGSTTLANDCGTFTMIKGAQTADPQVQMALSADANGDFSITTSVGDITLSAADDIYLTATGGQIYAGGGAIQMGSATADCSTFTMIKGTVGSDPQTQLAIDGSGNFSITTTVGDITLTAADDFFVSVDGNIELALTGAALYPQSDGGLTLGITNTNEWGGLYMNASSAISWDNGDVTLTHSAGTLTYAGGNLTYTVAAGEYMYLDATGAAHTDTNGVLKVASTTATTNVINVNLTAANTATTGNTAYNLYASTLSSAVVTGTNQTLYNGYFSIAKSGADTNANTTTIYGVYSTASNTGATDTGTKNTYAGYFTATGDTAGTATTYGIYATATGGDTNYAAYLNGIVQIGTAASTLGVIQISGSTSGTITIQPAVAAGTYTLTLPTSDGDAGQVLSTDGSGVLSWVSNSKYDWTEVTGTSQAAAVNNGYICNNAGLVTVTLPDTAAVGSVIQICGKGAGLWKLQANAGETIKFGNATTSSGGSLAAVTQYDTVEVVCITADTTWVVLDAVGNLTVA